MTNESKFDTDRGNGGETHQHVPTSGPHEAGAHLTTNQGIRVSDNQNSVRRLA
jgi:catalase